MPLRWRVVFFDELIEYVSCRYECEITDYEDKYLDRLYFSCSRYMILSAIMGCFRSYVELFVNDKGSLIIEIRSRVFPFGIGSLCRPSRVETESAALRSKFDWPFGSYIGFVPRATKNVPLA